MEISRRNIDNNKFPTHKYILSHMEVFTILRTEIKKTKKLTVEVKVYNERLWIKKINVFYLIDRKLKLIFYKISIRLLIVKHRP